MPAKTTKLADRILDKALELGESSSWEHLRLNMIADELEITLADIHAFYPQKDDLVEAWFDRADHALLSQPLADDFLELPISMRLQQLLMTWFDALSPHRRLTRGMLAYKLEPGHIHLQVLGLMRVSRTVQWLREAARLESTDLRRILEETSLTAIYLASFSRWLFDDSPDSGQTRRFLDRALHRWEVFGNGLCRCCSHRNTVTETPPPTP